MAMTAEEARQLLDYDSQSGRFTWKVSLSPVVPVGSIAGTLYKNGRRYIAIGRKRYFAARLAWLYVYGEWPSGQIDHKNLNRSDDSIDNLRAATGLQNSWNKGVLKSNLLGVKGVSARPSSRHGMRYRARIRVHGRLISLGDFQTPQEASTAYGEASKRYFGEFARQ